MQSGLLWYDDDPQRTLEAKIGRAAERYREKYGRLPDTCYVHPQAVSVADGNGGAAVQVTYPLAAPVSSAEPPRGAGHKKQPAAPAMTASGTLRVISAPNILRHHFWLGESGGS